MFGYLKDARDGSPFESLRDLASNRDKRSHDALMTICPDDFSVSSDGTVFYGDYKVLDSVHTKLSSIGDFPCQNFTKLDPDIVESILRRKIQSENKMFRFWEEDDGSYSIRAIVSEKYQPIPTEKSLDELLSTISNQDSLRIVHTDSNATGFSAEVVDITTDFDISQLGDPGPVPNDIVFAGWKLTGDDTGSAAQKIYSYLWRLVCNNGSSVIDRQMCARATHKGLGNFSGVILSIEDWKKFIVEATMERIKAVDTQTASKKFAKMVNRPNLSTFEKAWSSLSDKTQPMPIEIPAPSDIIDQIIQETNIRYFRRIDLAEAFGFAANYEKSREERDAAQAFSGRLFVESLEESCPVLASLLINH